MLWKCLKPGRAEFSTGTILALAVLSTAWTPLALAKEFPKVIQLTSLDGIIGFRIDGVASGDQAGCGGQGCDVASAGDVNGDGLADVIVGAPNADPNGTDSGSSYVVFGKRSGFAATINLSTLDGSNGFRLDGAAPGDLAGFSAASAGDVNGDGLADVIVGAPNADPNGTDSGSSYVVFGKGSDFAAAINLSTLDGSNGFRLDGVARGDNSARSVAPAGDVNGDGFDDLIIGAPFADPHGDTSGSTYVVFGKGSGFAPTINLSSLNDRNGFRLDGANVLDLSSWKVASAGDVNGDGFADVIIGAPWTDYQAFNSGSSYVVFGRGSRFPATMNLSMLDGTNGFRIDNNVSGCGGGWGASAGDVNGDGYADVIINGSYVVFGKGSGFTSPVVLQALDGTDGFHLGGISAGRCVDSVHTAGDVNGDGFADVIDGVYLADPHGSTSGSSFVVFGKGTGFVSTIDLSSLNGSDGFRLDGVATGDRSGISAASAGDVNGDGFADVIVGATGADPHGSESGSSYVLFGRPPDSARTRVGSAAGQYISGGAFEDTLKGQDGADRLEGRGGADKLIGGAKKDAASYLHSAAAIRADLANPGSNTGDAAGDSYTSIKNLVGSRFTDELTGNGFSNSLTGDQGVDVLTGAGGADLFVYNAVRDSPPGAGRDKITDFDAGTASTSVDKIVLRTIDAQAGPGNQAFTWVGTATFSGTKGELRVEAQGTSAIVQGDVDGDGAADLEIELLNFADLSTLTAIDFRL